MMKLQRVSMLRRDGPRDDGVVEDDIAGALPRQLIGRLGGALFFLSGLATLASIAVPTSADLNHTWLILVSGAAMLVGIVEWLLPWHRWPRWGTLTLLPVAFGLIALANALGAVDPYRYGVFFVVIFTWIGIGHPRCTSLFFAPLAAGAYVLPLLFAERSSTLGLVSVFYTIPVCILVGELLAWTSARMRKADSELNRRVSEARFRTLVQNASDIIIVVEANGTVRYVSSSVQRVLGRQAEDQIGQSLVALVHPDDVDRVANTWAKLVPIPGIAPLIQFRARHSNGSWRSIESLANNLLDDPEVNGVVINSRDITDQKLLEAELVHQAFHDPLTGLANRALFMDRAGHALARSNRLPASIAVLFLDLDNFKVVNDSLGHVLGDALLVAVGRCLASHVRPMDTVARLGGDEFTVLAEDLPDTDEAARLAERLAACLANPFTIEHRQVHVTASIGIAVCTPEHERADELLREADLAMYRAKSAGKARYELFEPAMNAEVMTRLARENDLRGALGRDELLLHYQPVVTLATSKITQVEALLRWQHPSGDLIRPADFVPLAEETSLILPIGSWVLATACQQARRWQDQAPDEPPLTMSVNVSIRQLQHPDFVAEVASVLQETGLPAEYLQLELTESVLVNHWEGTIATLQSLHQLGVQLALDDFGTGYSSLSYLQRLPASVLKVDKMFVNEVATNRETQAILAAIVRLGHAMGMQVTAEGIETAAQLQCVHELGVDMVQGYHYGCPLPADAASRHIADYALTQG